MAVGGGAQCDHDTALGVKDGSFGASFPRWMQASGASTQKPRLAIPEERLRDFASMRVEPWMQVKSARCDLARQRTTHLVKH